jgi:Transcription elongation factor, GreA/GreB, C-term
MKEKDQPAVEPDLLVEVEITYEDGRERLKLVIVPDELADFKAGFLGEGTPLAQAILGERVGSQIPYHYGDARSVEVLSITETDRKPPSDAGDRRKEAIQQALEQAERTSAMMFASSFSGKWGDYDPNAIEGQEKKESNHKDKKGEK